MTDIHYSKPERGMPPYVVHSSVLRANDVVFLSPETIHQTRVSDKMDTCTLTIYAPPYEECMTYCPKTGRAEPMCVSSSDCGGSH